MTSMLDRRRNCRRITLWVLLGTLLWALPAPADICDETAPPLIPLGSPSGCDHCRYNLFPGGLEPHPDTQYYIESDVPERLLTPGVLYATVPVLPPDLLGGPILAMRTQIVSGGFTAIDGDFDVMLWHTSSPGDGTQPRRIVVYVRNDGTGPVQVNPQQVMVTDGGYTQMSETLGVRVMENDWDAPVGPVSLPAGAGNVIAYSKRFAASYNSSDTSANVNCFGRVRAAVTNADPGTHPTTLTVYVIAIPGANVNQNKSLAESLLDQGAQSGEPFDLNTPPSGCANRRATGVMETFVWRSSLLTLDAAALSAGGERFRMGMADINTQTCPEGRQTAEMILHPGYVRPDSVGNYLKDYRVTLRLINTDRFAPRTVDVTFEQPSAQIGLGWQMVIGGAAAADAAVDARPVRTGWGSATAYSFFAQDGGPLEIGPCEERYVTLRFEILGGSSLPFDIAVRAETPSNPIIVDNLDAGFSTVGSWSVSANSGYYGTNSLYHAGDGGASTATWQPVLPDPGQYRVSAWWVVSGNRAQQAPYTITHRGGTTTVYADQTDPATANQWNTLGEFPFNAGSAASVTLSAAVPITEFVSADAVRVDWLGPLPEPEPGDIDADGDVDLDDYARFAECLEEQPACDGERAQRSDLDGSGNVNLSDFQVFQTLFPASTR